MSNYKQSRGICMLCANTILFYVSDLASVDFRMVEKPEANSSWIQRDECIAAVNK